MKYIASTSLVAWLCLLVGCGRVTGALDAATGDRDSGTVDAAPGEVIDSAAGSDDAPLPDGPLPDADPAACANEGMPCGPVTSCDGDFEPCGGFTNTCDEIGSQSRTCTDFTCVQGQCTAGTPYEDTRSCTRSTDGDSCGQDTTCGACGNFSNLCDETGTRTCTTTARECSNGSCELASSSNSTQSCTRTTDGDVCSATTAGCPTGQIRDLCCSASGSCGTACGTCN